MSEKEFVEDFDGDWVCLCANTPRDKGFYFCEKSGKDVEPTPEEWTTKLYVCRACGRLIDGDTLEVVGGVGKPVLMLMRLVESL